MIRTEPVTGGRAPAINTMRGEFEAVIAGDLHRFDTRLSTIAAIEDACGGRAVVEVLNGIIVGRRAKDQIPLLAAALAATGEARETAEGRAARATVGEAEAFILAFIFALGFTVGPTAAAGGEHAVPLDGRRSGATGAPSRSAA